MWLAVAVVALVAAFTVQPGEGGPAGAGRQTRRPNILFILTDDQRPDTLAALGNRTIRTPHLDTLVRSGTAFTRAVSPNPLCVPSRAEILTGCSGFRNGVLPGFSDRLDPALPLWPETLRKAGYRTWHVGKWHVSGRPTQRGYDASEGLFAAGVREPPEQVDHAGRPVTGYRGWVVQTDDGRLMPERGVGLTPAISRGFADAAIRLIREKAERPFFLHVNFTAPHDPLLFPPGYERKYTASKMPVPANFLPEHPFDHGNARGRDELLLPFPRTPSDVRAELAAYYAVIEHMDAQIGRILEALKASGQAHDTVVLFSSDHGLAIGSHGLRGKQNMYEHTVGVPLIVSGPGIPRGKRCASQVYLRDLYPTACELAGVPVPDAVEGRSLLPLLRGGSTEFYPEVYGYFQDVQRMVRTDRWKLIRYPRARQTQLFDLREDPHERRNLADEARHTGIRQLLEERLAAWQTRVKDPLAANRE